MFEYQKQHNDNRTILITEYTDEGKSYIKHLIEKYSNEYQIPIFLYDEVYEVYEQKSSNKPISSTYPVTKDILKLI